MNSAGGSISRGTTSGPVDSCASCLVGHPDTATVAACLHGFKISESACISALPVETAEIGRGPAPGAAA